MTPRPATPRFILPALRGQVFRKEKENNILLHLLRTFL
jgi:hypothetical protein